ncbi:Xenotropic and polytropic retrovirus receptor 1 [Taxawa tesnikishii (nom. ined.)]|nr:Xenotropic and polytropic retrovirus receptor 1 [Dothideales sp. JES 119]
MDPEDINDDSMSRPRSYSRPSSPKSPDLSRTPTRPNGDHSGNAFEVGKTKHSLAPRYRSIFQPKRVNSMPGTQDARPLVKRMMSLGGRHQNAPSQDDIAMDAYREVDFRQAEFFMFLDREMEKIEDFYKSKEDEATERLKVLREQLHIMRDRRLEEIMASQTAQLKHQSQSTKRSSDALLSPDRVNERTPILGGRKQRSLSAPWLADVARPFERAKPGRVGKTSQAMKELGTPSGPRAMDEERDYILRPGSHEVPYRTAKRKLKIALAEYYRGLELLKSYALLNRTAFRKINKKFDKTVNARPSGRYMAEKVNKAYFVRSEVLDGHLQAVEDLYARYFERGNHKIAVGKLRAKIARAGDYTASVFRNGLLFAAGSVFGIEGLTYGAELLYHPDAVTSTHTSYLMQIYGGYLMMLLLMLFFCLACRVWGRAKVNYAFVFEFDTRHHLDWRQLCEVPCLLWFVFGLTLWLNYTEVGGKTMYLYWPAVLIAASAFVVLNPLPLLYHRSRFWFLYSNVVFAGLYPVEFRDFFLGDMFCSLTYAMGNIELFFCLYAQGWSNPPMCNSSHSRLLGFFSALPGVWRALQCLRRYYDTRNVFPHLVNCGKYIATICMYMSLSIWDVVMDWSLLDPYAKRPFLRQTLAYKNPWWYYGAMLIDPIIRFNWIFYVIYANDMQHSNVVSFFVALSEACRRGVWIVFRVENEHCTNVGRFRASRDVPLPYDVHSDESTPADGSPREPRPGGIARSSTEQGSDAQHANTPPVMGTTATDLERGPSRTSAGSLRQRRRDFAADSPNPFLRTLGRVGTYMHLAHAQDFERRRRPEVGKAVEDDDRDAESDESEAEAEEAPEQERVQVPHGHADEMDTAPSGAARGEEVQDQARDEERHMQSTMDISHAQDALDRAGQM